MLSRTRTRRANGQLTAAIAVLGALTLASPASAAIFTVDVTGDRSDTDLSDAVCDSTPVIEPVRATAAAGPFPGIGGCSLRAAIQEANDTPGPDDIHFNIPGGGVKTIAPGAPLPELKDRVTVDGYTQPGAHPNTKAIANGDDAVLLVELSGANAGPSARGLEIDPGGGGSVIRGLVINRFAISGIALGAASGTIEGNFIGTDPSGTVDRGNGFDGIFVVAPTTTVIGGTSRGARNVISGNGRWGITANNRVTVQGNHIGTTKGGAQPLGNDVGGLWLGAPNNLVGGAGDLANVIAFNRGDGIDLENPFTGSRFSRNRIFLNREQAIDLNDDDTTPNDSLDADTGENNLQNFPTITSAVTSSSGRTTVTGQLKSTPNSSFTIELFRNRPGEGEAEKFIGSFALQTDTKGVGNFSVRTNPAPVGDLITGTATDSEGSTSEVSSSPRKVTAPPPVLE